MTRASQKELLQYYLGHPSCRRTEWVSNSYRLTLDTLLVDELSEIERTIIGGKILREPLKSNDKHFTVKNIKTVMNEQMRKNTHLYRHRKYTIR
jgi:hypothetical protein